MNDNIKAGADIHSGDGGYSVGTEEKYDEFVKGRNHSLGKMRIKELINKVGTDVSGKWVGIDNIELLAELIVKECAGELIKWKDEPFPYDPEFGARLIKEHFGVE
jgi:hypothetical protein